VNRGLDGNLELDDDRERIDRVEVHRWLSEVSYWAAGRARETQERLIDTATRVVGLYDGDRQIGFCRAASDKVSFVYLADVYVLEEYRGRGLGEALVGFMLDDDELANVRWFLHTTNMHALYRKFGFEDPDYKVMERRPSNQSSESG
jgi:GNAT superfamily N-acetyltransferase